MNTENIPEVMSLLNQMSEIEQSLKNTYGVIRSRKMLGDIGEWYATILFGLELAEDLSQKGYDCVCPKTSKTFQVKTDRKGEGHGASVWMPEFNGTDRPFDELLIFWLSENYKIKHCFRIPVEDLNENKFSKMKSTGKLNLTSNRLIENGYSVAKDSIAVDGCPNEIIKTLFQQ